MRRRQSFVQIGALLVMVGATMVACQKGYRSVVVVTGDKAEIRAIMEGGAFPSTEPLWVKDRIVLFRTTTTLTSVPGSPAGTAGHIYRVNDRLQIEDIGQFDPSLSDTVLASRYAR